MKRYKPSRTAAVSDNVKRGYEVLVRTCANLKRGEKALVVSDTTTCEVGRLITETAKTISSYVRHIVIKPLAMHGQEPPSEVAREMMEYAVVFGITRMSMAHTHARQKASLNKVRYLSLPDYNLQLLASPALQVNFKDITPTVQHITDILNHGKEMRLETELGTKIQLKINGRQGNCCPGWCVCPGAIASPPDIESNIAPLEEESNGTVVIDGSIPCDKLGLLKNPITLAVKRGRITKIYGESANILEEILNKVKDSKAFVFAEVGFGLNPKAKLRGIMLEDEGCLGTVHFGFGSNISIGGKNNVSFHLDTIIRYPKVYVDGQVIFEKGRLLCR